MSSTQTYYFRPSDDYKPYAFFDKILNKWVYFNAKDQFLWGQRGQEFINLNYPLKTSPTSELSDLEYTAYYYYEIEFKPGSPNRHSLQTMGSA